MRKLLSLILLAALLVPTVCACQRSPSAAELMSEFIDAYGAEGIVYRSACTEGDEGYLAPEKLGVIYQYSGRFPEDYAIFLNSRPDYGSECAFFVTRDVEERIATEQMCLERIRLLGGGFVKRSGSVVFYSTMQDGERAERIFEKIIK